MIHFKVIWEKLVKLFSIPWHPIAISAYPVLALLATNVGQAKPSAVSRPLLVCIALAGVIFILLRLLFHDWNRAAFLTTLWVVLFFSYGHLYLLLTEKIEDVNITPWLLIAWFLLAVAAVFWAK